MSTPRQKSAVIVVNSEVSRGSVGGRATVFVLERLGFPVWWVPTVTLPWHAGQGPATRLRPTDADFTAFLADLAVAPWLGEVGAIMTGYLGAASQVGPIVHLVDAVRRANPDAIYLCDPIIGDVGGLYQPEVVAAAIRDELLPRADMATPNRHEFAWLTGTSPSDNAELTVAARSLGPREVVVTSAFAEDGAIGNLLIDESRVSLVSHDVTTSPPHGTGDLLSALYLGQRLEAFRPVDALERAAAATWRLIRLAGELGTDEMPLVAGQAHYDAAPRDVRLSTVEEAAT